MVIPALGLTLGVLYSRARHSTGMKLSALREARMEQILINLIAGAAGGGAAGKSSPNFDLGTAGNLIAGAVGGGVLGQIVALAMPAISASLASGNFSVGGVIANLVSGGAGGAILTVIIGALKNRAT
jgi:hypothetical protein